MKSILAYLLLFAVATANAQDRYQAAMKQQVGLLDSASTFNPASLNALSNTFERIANAEQTQWLPYYYAAYCLVNEAFMTQDKTKVDPISDKAALLAEKAVALKGADSELSCLLSLIAVSRIAVDPMTRGARFGTESAELLEKAKAQNPENPRVYLLQGQNLMFTPEAFGGSKSKGKELLNVALQKFTAFKPDSDIAPRWGEAYTKELLKMNP
ncbi:hypothetical protein [Chitinophaga rhizosphaerae]|uniref:hypothetical protein n=1 Tax=Chitinophaga rhizosphaerae TaxID=1864947 RepID=UPI000F7FB5EA|nr:hypothetical protein [Chitinophaga rhizosphaerae]